MTQRHPTQWGSTVLVTICTHERFPYFEVAEIAQCAVECLYKVKELHPFELFAFVIMPDHCHLLIRARKEFGISRIINSYKSAVVLVSGMQKIWQKRFHVKIVDDMGTALRYIHANPIKKQFVQLAEDYPWSSASKRWTIDDIPSE